VLQIPKVNLPPDIFECPDFYHQWHECFSINLNGIRVIRSWVTFLIENCLVVNLPRGAHQFVNWCAPVCKEKRTSLSSGAHQFVKRSAPVCQLVRTSLSRGALLLIKLRADGAKSLCVGGRPRIKARIHEWGAKFFTNGKIF
jgi:hypothetical protein